MIRRIVKIFTFIILLSLPAEALAGIYGYCRDNSSNVAIKDAGLTLTNVIGRVAGTATTNSSGYYSIDTSGLSRGVYTLKAWHSLYAMQTVSVVISSGDLRKDFYLKKNEVITVPPPTVNNVTSPTNQNKQTLSGTKQANTSIWINGTQAVSLNSSTSWQKQRNLSEGSNRFEIFAKNSQGNMSISVYKTIVCDTIPPVIIITSPDDEYVTSKSKIALQGTVDGVTFTEKGRLRGKEIM